LGVSGLIRNLREKYHLSIPHNGHWPPISWGRRIEPSARILYYHRVNDENDPFSPSMATALFAQQMRFVARHYKVVSLTEALDRLEARVPENVLAITFDDGYQDNYTNAFPILQQYGLTATIFLTTGGLDEREPLWFEQLAQALKKSAQTFVDLEIDIPRRFWLRSERERLDANAGIYGLLRNLSDADRRLRVSEVLKHLAVPADQAWADKMLTWDQVRLMKARGIDFGGHTVTHPFLSKLTQERATWEISECKRRIEQELQAPVKHFAYPSGREMDFASANKELLQIAGYEAALTTIWGMNFSSTDRMELRRGQPWEDNPALFAYKFDWYQLVNG
jgi:peptidoglycan/xylan/chitin deacetylase (PgdA/CDA1 family)